MLCWWQKRMSVTVLGAAGASQIHNSHSTLARPAQPGPAQPSPQLKLYVQILTCPCVRVQSGRSVPGVQENIFTLPGAARCGGRSLARCRAGIGVTLGAARPRHQAMSNGI